MTGFPRGISGRDREPTLISSLFYVTTRHAPLAARIRRLPGCSPRSTHGNYRLQRFRPPEGVWPAPYWGRRDGFYILTMPGTLRAAFDKLSMTVTQEEWPLIIFQEALMRG